jgi:OmpA family/PEGA domain
MRRTGQLFILVLAFALGAGATFAQDGKLKIKVTPPQAYVFVDGKPAEHEGGRTISLAAGKHTIAAVNYGYKIWSQDVNIESGKTTDLDAKLEAYGGTVNGPWGRVYLGGEPHAAVLANGTTPGYYVGHVDEFNNDFWIWKQELILPVGHHHLTVVKGGKTVWEGDVDVQANKKVSVDMSKNTQKTTDWPRGTKLKDLPRFHAGVASATIAVSPVKIGSFTATPSNINCAENSSLAWQTTDAVDTSIDNSVGNQAASGNQNVSPHATTNYTLTASGPGGRITSSATVNVNTAVQANITATPGDLHYRKIGDKVLTDDTGTVTWNSSNANAATLNGNAVDPNGSQQVKADPADTSQVPEGGQPRTVDEQKAFTLTATNVCGGSGTASASFHVTGSVEPIPTVVLQSIFYPTDYPDKRHPQVGLVRSQQLTLATLADGFKKYLEYDGDAKLSIEAYADIRGGREYNQDLSERRVERIKQYLVSQGIASDKIQTAAYGKERPLPKGEVKSLESSNPNPPPKARARAAETDWLAYNRRADIVLLPSGKKSARYFPHAADDSGVIWAQPKEPLSKVEKAD